MHELMETISYMRVSSNPLDVVPTHFLLKVMDAVGPVLLSIFNSSLLSGCVPDCFKIACITPLLKKPGLDPHNHQNYRPISKLTFISKNSRKNSFHSTFTSAGE